LRVKDKDPEGGEGEEGVKEKEKARREERRERKETWRLNPHCKILLALMYPIYLPINARRQGCRSRF